MFDDIDKLKINIDNAVKQFEIENPFTPGITNVTSYVGYMLLRLYETFFKPEKILPGKSHTLIDLDNIDLLNSLWDIYRTICLKYGSTPTVQRYCTFIGISRETFDRWKNQERRTSQHGDTAKRFLSDSESDLVARAVDSNSIGAIFALKAGFGYNDQAPQTLTLKRGDETPLLSQEEIKQRLELLEESND